MRANKKGAIELVSTKKLFRVPAFQRRFAWKPAQFERLWIDISSLIDGSKKKHFIGTIILSREKSNSNLFNVIDGQQRLATLAILFEVLKSQWKRFYERSKLKKPKAKIPKVNLTPTLSDKPAFQKLFDDPAFLLSSLDKNVYVCWEFFSKKLDEARESAPSKPAYFEKLIAALNKLEIVQIDLDAADDAQTIFQTINFNGVELTAADLARNLILMSAKKPEAQQALFENYWRPIEQTIEDALGPTTGKRRQRELGRVLPEFLRDAMMVHSGKYVSSLDLHSTLTSYFRAKDVEAKLTWLLTLARDYSVIISPTQSKTRKDSKRLIERLHRIQGLGMTTHIPLMLVMFELKRDKRISLDEFLKTIDYIESFVVRRAFDRKVSRDLHKILASAAGGLKEKSGDSKISADAIVASILVDKKWPDDSTFEDNFRTTPIYSNARAIAKFVLVNLENSYGGEKELEERNREIEHIYPQSPNSDWDLEVQKGLNVYLHTVGNLTLVASDYNKALSNRGFLEKKNNRKGGLKKSPLRLNEWIAKQKEWNVGVVEKRTPMLFKRAKVRWPKPEVD